MNPLVRASRLSFVSALLLCPALVFAQRPAPRIRGPIEAAPSVPLAGSLNPHLRAAQDLGPLPPDTLISGITLVFSRSAAQESDLQQLLAQQTTPSSPLYRRWLTPDVFAARFGVAASDIAATETWLQSHGFTIDPAAHAPDRITFSGTTAQIQLAFGAELHRFRSNNELHFAPASELLLPAALAPVTAAVLHLSDFRPKPNLRTIRPLYTTYSGQTHFLGPKDISTMYDLWPLSNSFYYGSGQTIAIVGQSFVPTDTTSSVYHFQTLLTRVNFPTAVIVPNSGVEGIFPGDEGESDIDLEYSSGVAQDATIFFVYTGSGGNYDVFDSLAFAITQDIAPVISISYGLCETLASPADLQQENALFEQAAAQGQTIIAASGDEGATACINYGTQDGVSTTQQQALAVGFPASSPYVTAVGGTQMAPGTFATGTSQYWTAASIADLSNSLLSYVPEVAWNEDSSSQGILASGGGSSSIFPRPAWQTGIPGMPSGSYRLVPDIALQASVANPGFIVCSDDPAITGGASSDCLGTTPQSSGGNYVISGGTSFGAPVFAAFVAVLNQVEHTSGLGNLNPLLYSLALQPSTYASAFHDITAGTTACVAGDGNCGTPGQSAYAATTGYDQATGLGSIDVAKLAAALPPSGYASLTRTSVAFTDSQSQLESGGAASAGDSVTINVVVAATIGAHGFIAPTGDVAVALDGQVLNAALPITSIDPTNSQSSVTFTFTAPSATGSHILIARYFGDATNAPSVGAYSVLVGNVIPSGSIALSGSPLTLSSNAFGSTKIAITPSGGYSGALSWSASYTGGPVEQTICYAVQSPPINGPTTATVNIGLGTSCTGPQPSGSAAPTRVQSSARVQRSAAAPPAEPSRKTPAAVSVALLLLALLPARRRRRLPLLAIAVLAIVPFGLSGCGGSGQASGGGGGGGGTNPGPQTYTLTFTAHDSINSTITASTSFTLTVD